MSAPAAGRWWWWLGRFAAAFGSAFGLDASAAPPSNAPRPVVQLPASAGRPIELVAALPGVLLNGVAVSPGGRIFISLPRWAGKPTPGVIELLADGSHRPFPGGDWNGWEPGRPAGEAFVSVHSISADADGNLWVVDEGPPFHGQAATAQSEQAYAQVLPKIVQIDVASGKVVQTYLIDRQAAPRGSNFGHVRLDEHFLYVSEPGIGSVIVIDRRTKQVRRRLAGAKAAKADPTIVPVFAGVPIAALGKGPQIHLDHMEIDATGEKLFFMSLFGPTLYSISIKDLTNWSLSDQDLEGRISVEGPVPAATGMRKDARGDLYICAITDFAIMRRTGEGGWEIVARDPRIYLPNNPSFGPDGDLYFPVSHPPGIPDIGVDGPPAIYRIRLGPGA